MKSCSFTGHRKVELDENLLNKVTMCIEKCINNGVTDFYSGGAIGWDTICSKIVLQLKEKYSHIKLHLILPCNQQEQTSKWNESQKLEYNTIIKLADTIEYTSNHYHKSCMKIRNVRLVELADICICYCSNNFRSGTAQTIHMAQRKGIPIINLYKKLNYL